ncbi:methyl-accepting chemotaxis protein [Kamptonema formosum]|uniref:methyl-accepting chemotaxis protein n=1 Tax=Kamptonema formosum TaxID=331992 RepID=UPI0003458725|nr:methyl-accepting chemotaxis protein [Oscillatoria sp. PCC 10802]
MFEKLKLQDRITFGYLVLLALSLVAAVLVCLQIGDLKQHISAQTIGQTLVRDSDRLALSIAGIERAARGYLLNQDESHLQNFNKNEELFEKSAKSLAARGGVAADAAAALTPAGERFAEILLLAKQSVEFHKNLIQLAQAGKVKKAIHIYASDALGSQARQLQIDLDAFSQKQHEIQAEKSQQVESSIDWLLAVVGASTLISLTVTLGLSLSAGNFIAQQIARDTTSIALSATQIASAATEQERSTSEQATSLNQVATTIDELGASSRKSAEQAETAATGTRQVLALVAGDSRLDWPAENGPSLKDQITAMQAQILQLSDRLSQIGSITRAVTDFANQTNMLALNAAVEAARAGDRGRGFTVVSSEIRRLADQSKKSAEQINALILDIKTATEATVIATDRVSQILDRVVEEINKVSLSVQQIALNARQQATATRQSADAVSNLNQSAQQIASSISQTKVGLQNLKEAAQKLGAFI